MRLFVLLFLILCFSTKGQITFNSKNSNPLTFYNYQKGKFTIIEDSLGCHEYDEKTKKWKFRKLTFIIEESFADFLREYYLLHEKGSKIYFVDRGCGYVYILENDTIKRHDKSFHHRNQYFGTFFLYKGMPHIFGGYGLFTFKNIITYYNPQEKEWNSYPVSGNAPSPRYLSHGMKIGNKFFVSGGSVKKGSYLKDCWVFDFTNLKWELKGNLTNSDLFKFNFEYFIDEHRLMNEQLNQKLISSDNKIYDFNYLENKLTVYQSESREKIKKILVENGLVLFQLVNHNYSKVQIVIEDASNFLLNKKNVEELVVKKENRTSSSINYPLLVIIGLLLLLSVFIFFRKKTGTKVTVEFSESEKGLIIYFCQQAENGIEIAQINDFVNSDNPSADTLKKRREGLIRSLKGKISQDCKINQDEVFIETKHTIDKRIKILILNSIALQRYQNLFKSNLGEK